jgi:hypothetical protein
VKPGVRFDIAILQGAIQGLIAGVAASFADNSAIISVGFSIIQLGIAGALVGILFQYIYGKAVVSDKMGPDAIQRALNTAAIRRQAV